MKASLAKKKTTAKVDVKVNTFPVVAIGASAGGLEAMMELLRYLPADTGMAFIYVQHLSPDHKSMLSEILAKKTSMIVQEIDDMDKIQPNNVFVIPYNKGIEVTDGHIKLIPRSDSSAAISIDILFSSLAAAQKERVIGVILSGSASDGTIGMKAIKHEGGLTFAQDDTAKFTSMPHSAIAAGVVDFTLSPKDIALELNRLSKNPLVKTIGDKNAEEDLIDNHNPDLKIILTLLHKETGVDFSAYKMNTIKRRIIRRMMLNKVTLLKDYANLLIQKKEEIDILYQDLLINVTSFFRDTDTHKYLKETIFPKLLKKKTLGDTLRIWVPACASGEEAYSIAMILLEIQESKSSLLPIQIFATDLSVQAINKARIGHYSLQELESVSPKRIQRFFVKSEGGFRVNKAVRDMCVFAQHNILRDPPFSRLDFISCCNLFIYFDIPAQKKTVNTFHYALNEDGFLMLGKSENISQSVNLFTAFNKKYKVFSRKINSGSRTLPALLPRFSQQSAIEIIIPNKNKTKQNYAINQNGLDNAIDALLVSDFMPASVVINHQMEIVQFRGSTDLFLTHPKGKPTFNILKMARPEIAFELRNAITKVIKTKQPYRKSGIEMNASNSETALRIMSLEIVPLKNDVMNNDMEEPLLLVVFKEHEQIESFFLNPQSGNKGASLAKDRRIKKLELELAAAQADALEIAMEHEAFTEELQSSNEEVVSSNEELQTLNEELETSKEEIESANEELTTTNQELQTRNDLLNEAYEYADALLSTLHEPMLVLDKNLRVKSANESFYNAFYVNRDETEGVLLYDLGNKQWDIPRLRELLDDILPRNTDLRDFEISHMFPSIGEKTMLLNARRIIQKMNQEELILLAISDVTKNKLFEKELMDAKINAENATKSKQQFLSNMSHEIRTPLNSILGFTSVLMKSQIAADQKEFVQAIHTSGKSLNLLINDILDLAKVDAGRMTFENQPFEIRKSIRSILHSFYLKIKEKNLEIVKEFDSKIPLIVLGDSVRLNQILLNLLSNAVKFTHKGKISVSLTLLKEVDENVIIEFAVTDTGIGVSSNKIDAIFNVFEQAEIGTANTYGGTGLGLAIVKQLIESQGGSISLKSKIGVGSTFKFSMPFGKTNIKAEEDEEIETLVIDKAIKGLKVLVAEDFELNKLLIKIILTDFGFDFDIVDNGKLAIEKLVNNNYDIILMDLQMPEMNGFEATEHIRQVMKSQIPIIALTADVTTADVSKCQEFGMNGYISKPINESLLYNKIVKLVKGKN
ncbi:MAG: chemotaxis protein CheB [Bacteroidota bacterium]|nr:chemotaxis protein CheB [Bacteroidota bacterium]